MNSATKNIIRTKNINSLQGEVSAIAVSHNNDISLDILLFGITILISIIILILG